MKKFIILYALVLLPLVTNAQSHREPFHGFEPVNKDSRNLKRTSLPSAQGKETLIPYARMALNLEYVGVALTDSNYNCWGACPIEVDGKIHLIVGRWPGEYGNWRGNNSDIAHYVSDNPEGPFKFAGILLNTEDLKNSGFVSPHTPRVKMVDGKFVIVFTAHHPKAIKSETQTIFMAVSESINGPWKLVGDNGIVVRRSTIEGTPTFGSKLGVCSPAFLKVGDKYCIYFIHNDATTATINRSGTFALAIADKLEGPYIIKGPCIDNISYHEDEQAFEWNGRYYLLLNDNFGGHCGIPGAQLLWKSDNGLFFKRENVVIASGPFFDYWEGNDQIGKETKENNKSTGRQLGKFERPSILIQNGIPAYFYGVSHVNINGGKKPVIYVFRIND